MLRKARDHGATQRWLVRCLQAPTRLRVLAKLKQGDGKVDQPFAVRNLFIHIASAKPPTGRELWGGIIEADRDVQGDRVVTLSNSFANQTQVFRPGLVLQQLGFHGQVRPPDRGGSVLRTVRVLQTCQRLHGRQRSAVADRRVMLRPGHVPLVHIADLARRAPAD